jgi:hypothetical protein
LKALALLAHDRKKYAVADIARILKADASEIASSLSSLTFIQISAESDEVAFGSESFRSFAAARLKLFRRSVEDLVIDDFLAHPDAEWSLEHLPGALHQANRFDDLIKYLSPDHFSMSLAKSQSLGHLQRQVELGMHAAGALSKDGDLRRFSIHRSALTRYGGVEVWGPEISARVALNEPDAALALAQSAVLKEDRLHLLAIFAKGRKFSARQRIQLF